MKTKLPFLTLAALGTLLVSLTPAPAQSPPVDPATGLPMTPRNSAMAALNPTTGLPTTPAEPQWIDPNWPNPDIVLTNVFFDGLPLSEVARLLREDFKDQFDILPMPQTFGTNWGDTPIQLQLKNVRANDVFNAMNMIFENDRTPLRWQLTMNINNRPLVMLRVLPEAQPMAATLPQPHRMVYFVGDLIGDAKSGGMTMDQIVNTIFEVWPREFGEPINVIQIHKDAELLVVNGTPEELEFIHQTLAALHQKVEAAQPKSSDAENLEELNKMVKTLKGLNN